ncbi:anti-sigma factor domain-containing protein [Paenibacillus sp. BSR1-1]|uniref:anti-sigma factor domain-containing protein n=1 Tax=Paenibacillus sp. BSR1-1 TaxID=3020845 RepID=UPI0025B1FC05|nr:anti-sigma factor domain-containing protein [Paenibacillus sp. BSR1-1]MDN3014988.1 anti-sigma factor domain-containing protein [Paenibacillus sp. BSR1-1]
MKKGIVMKIDNGFLTLLTPEGEFLRARKQDQTYSIGEEIHFFPFESSRTNLSFHGAKNFLRQKSVWAAAMSFIIILGGVIIPMYQDNKAYAYMSIDVNPSIELVVNKKSQVVKLTGYNKEGKKVISELDDWEKQNVSDVTKAILAEMKDEGYLNNNEKIILSAVRTKHLEKTAEEKLQKNIKDIKSTVKRQHHELTVVEGTKEDLKKAHKHGLTTGKSMTNKDKENLKTNVNNKENNPVLPTPSEKTEKIEKTDPTGPPSQIKKQTENTTINNRGSENKNNRVGGNSIPPGQLKKMEEEKIKQNYDGQTKKQNYGQTKKQSVPKENPSQKNKIKNNEKKNGNAKVHLNVNLDDKEVNLEVNLNGLIK